MTGVEINGLFKQRIDQAYNQWYDAPRANRILESSYYNVVDRLYSGLAGSKVFGYISSLINTDYSFTPTRNIIQTKPFSVKSVVLATNTITVVTNQRHFIETGDTIILSGVLGTVVTNINGTYVATKVNDTTFTCTTAGATLTTYTANSGQVVFSVALTDYGYHLASKVYYEGEYRSIDSISLSSGEVTIDVKNLRTNDTVKIKDATGTAAINGEHDITVLNRYTISLGTTFSGTYGGGAKLALIEKAYAKMLYSNLKTSKGKGVYFQVSENVLKYDISPIKVELDYIKIPPVAIDVENEAVDYLNFYDRKFIEMLIMEAASLYGIEARDLNAYQLSQNNRTL